MEDIEDEAPTEEAPIAENQEVTTTSADSVDSEESTEKADKNNKFDVWTYMSEDLDVSKYG